MPPLLEAIRGVYSMELRRTVGIMLERYYTRISLQKLQCDILLTLPDHVMYHDQCFKYCLNSRSVFILCARIAVTARSKLSLVV